MYRVEDDEQFVLDFLKQEKVLLVHGRGFNWKDPDHFRIVYLPRVDELAEIQEKCHDSCGNIVDNGSGKNSTIHKKSSSTSLYF